LLCNQLGEPVDFVLTAGQVHDATQARTLLAERKATYVIADKGYDSDPLVTEIESRGAQAVIPPRCYRKHRRRYDKHLYRQRNRIERCFAKLKQFRRFATRYEKNKECFHAVVALACTMILLNLIVDTP
jgi:transposase